MVSLWWWNHDCLAILCNLAQVCHNSECGAGIGRYLLNLTRVNAVATIRSRCIRIILAYSFPLDLKNVKSAFLPEEIQCRSSQHWFVQNLLVQWFTMNILWYIILRHHLVLSKILWRQTILICAKVQQLTSFWFRPLTFTDFHKKKQRFSHLQQTLCMDTVPISRIVKDLIPEFPDKWNPISCKKKKKKLHCQCCSFQDNNKTFGKEGWTKDLNLWKKFHCS